MTIEAIPTRHHDLARASAMTAVLRGIRSIFTAINRHAERRRADAELTTMDPNVLRDIGVDQSDMMAVLYTSRRERRRYYDGF